MRVLISLEQRYQSTPDGSVWTPNAHSCTFFARYLEAFDHVDVLARVLAVQQSSPGWIRADGPRVMFRPIPHFLGPLQYLLGYRSISRSISHALVGCEAVIMRVPSVISHTVTKILRDKGHPFALEVVGDPYDVFSPNSVRHIGRPFFRYWFSYFLRRQCRDARAVAYVTTRTLQNRYPSSALMAGISDVVLPDSAFTTAYSSVELSAEQIVVHERKSIGKDREVLLIFVGSLAQLYKAPDILLKAFAKAVRNGCNLRLKLVGDGRYKRMLQDMAQQLGIAGRCEFAGALPAGAPVMEALDQADIFVLPSRVEGLPRAIIEAMARGLPCIGSTAGGIPELLPSEDLVSPGDIEGLAKLIQDVAGDQARQKQMSIRNLAESRQYADSVLNGKRLEFYRRVRENAAKFLKNKDDLSNDQTEAFASR